MLDVDAVESNLTGAVALVVVTSLEVARRALDGPSAQRLGRLPIDGHAQAALLVLELVAELLADLDLADLRHLQAAHVRDLADTQGQGAALVDEELAERLLGHLVVDLDLPDDGAVLGVVGLDDRQARFQAVGRALGVPGLRRRFAELGAAVLAVGRGHARGAAGRAGHLHDDGAVRLGCVEVLRAGVALAAVELGARDLVDFAFAASWELEAELGKVTGVWGQWFFFLLMQMYLLRGVA